MFKKENLKGADISTTFCGIKLQSPYILSSGPLSYAAEGLIRAHQAGCGAVVTKTIRLGAAINPVHHIGKIGSDSLINCEKWADSDRLVWYEREIPMAREAGAIVIGSVGHTLMEAQAIVKDVEKAGAHMIELVSYTEDTLIPMLEYTKSNVSVPVICKLSGNWPDAVGTASRCLERGADGICAIDSIGPTLKIDINKARPEMMGASGYGWLSGAAIRPISLRINSEIARNHPGLTSLYGSGGCMNAEDAIEFLMVGCTGVGVCSVGILKDIEYIERMCYDLSKKLASLGYNSIEEVRGVALPNFPSKELISELEFTYTPYFAPCQQACPAGVDVPGYVDNVRKGDYLEAYNTISINNPFPAICGRVCDHPCELKCRRVDTGDNIQIRLLKRAAADRTYELCGENLPLPEVEAGNGQKVAVIGSGPAGLSAAFYLAKKGYEVKVFEALPVAGGMLAVGIPEYRLPKVIMKNEIKRIERMGVEIRTGVTLGRDLTFEELRKDGFAGIVLAVGACLDSEIPVSGTEYAVSGITFLRDVNLGTAGSLEGKKVIVAGGGNAAIDAARSALRLGSEDVTVVYRRTREEMPAYAEEVAHAEEEGVKFLFLAAPYKIEKDSFYYTPMKLGETDASGRRKPVPTGESPVTVEADLVILAVGQKVDKGLMPGMDTCSGYKYKTVEKDVFAAGDCLSEPASVIEAIAAGREAASEVDLYLGGDGKATGEVKKRATGCMAAPDDDSTARKAAFVELKDRVPGFCEVELGLSEADSRIEASRCLKCGCINCGLCVAVCAYDARKLDFPVMTVDRNACRSCGLCASVCPTGALTAAVAEQTEKHKALEKESADFYASFSSGGH